jgi:hypothetical protein
MFSILIIRLLYLTPIGYLISSADLLSNKSIKGINVNLSKYSPIRANISSKPDIATRINWLLNSIILFFQGFQILSKNIGGEIGGGYAILATIFGGICFVSAIFPKIQWNKNLFG